MRSKLYITTGGRGEKTSYTLYVGGGTMLASEGRNKKRKDSKEMKGMAEPYDHSIPSVQKMRGTKL